MARDDDVLDLWDIDGKERPKGRPPDEKWLQLWDVGGEERPEGHPKERKPPDRKWLGPYPKLRTAVIVSVVIGIAVTSYLIIRMDEPYASFYIFPDSINYSAADSMVSFSYGIFSHEGGVTTYSLNIYAGDQLERTDQHELARGETGEYHEAIPVPADALLPLKVSLQLSSDRGDTEETHFWLRNSSPT
ncbi:MAG TPA: hypothetical protein VLU98_00140 [Methanomicrobiales archaeon]|nr:hypothetical protein [Methanomicrobiales archaeon]